MMQLMQALFFSFKHTIFLVYRGSVGERLPAAPGFFSKESLFLAEIKE